jgi:hypothetical protein
VNAADHLPAVFTDYARDPAITDIGNLRSTTNAADEETIRLLPKGGNAKQLVELVLQVLNEGRHVVDALDRLLA